MQERGEKQKAKVKPAARQPVKVYDIQPDETSKAFQAFVTYRDFGFERSLEKVAKELKKSGALIARWSSQYQWVERAAAWDAAEQQRKDAERAVDERRVWKDAQVKERDRRKKLLAQAYNVALSSLNKVAPTKEQITADGKLDNYKPDADMIRAATAAFKTYMEQSRQEFNDLPMQKVAPVDARDPEGETPYQPRLDDFTGVIEAVKQMIEADRDAD